MIRKKARKPNPLKPQTRSAVKKGPARDEKHLEKIRAHHCIAFHCYGVAQAHHVRCIGPRTMGKRVSDYLTVPLCARHHAELHSINEGYFWGSAGIRPEEWIAQFSKEGAAEIARINAAKDAP